MPRSKRIAQPLSLADIDAFGAALNQFVERAKATVAALDHASQLEARLQRILAIANDRTVEKTARARKTKPKATGATKTPKTGKRARRASSPVDPAAVIEAVHKSGKEGASPADIAADLAVEVGSLRKVIWQLRDDGKLRSTGKFMKTRYHVAETSKPGPQPKAVKNGSATASA